MEQWRGQRPEREGDNEEPQEERQSSPCALDNRSKKVRPELLTTACSWGWEWSHEQGLMKTSGEPARRTLTQPSSRKPKCRPLNRGYLRQCPKLCLRETDFTEK